MTKSANEYAYEKRDALHALLALIAPAPPAPEAITVTLPSVPARGDIWPCDRCGGDGSWHQMIAPSPDTRAIRIHRTTMCPVCQGGGWVNRAVDAALAPDAITVSDAMVERGAKALHGDLSQEGFSDEYIACLAAAVLAAALAPGAAADAGER